MLVDENLNVEKIELVYSLLRFFDICKINNSTMDIIFSLENIKKENVDYLFQNLIPTKLPQNLYLLYDNEFLEVVFDYLDSWDKNIIDKFIFCKKASILETKNNNDNNMFNYIEDWNFEVLWKKIDALLSSLLNEIHPATLTSTKNNNTWIWNWTYSWTIHSILKWLTKKTNESYYDYLSRVYFFSWSEALWKDFDTHSSMQRIIYLLWDKKRYFFDSLEHLWKNIKNFEKNCMENLSCFEEKYNSALSNLSKNF